MNVRPSLLKLTIFTVVAALIGAMLVFTLRDSTFQHTATYHATFTDVSGLRSGDRVRVAGVSVGRVTGVSLVGTDVRVTFTVPHDQPLTTSTQADVKYQNLLGQRYLALGAGDGGGTPLPKGGTIAVDHTAPALNLTDLLNGFQPLFAALTPAQVNKLSGSLVAVLQGESGRTADLMTQLAAVATNLAGRDTAIDEVVDNLSVLARSVGTHSAQLDQVIRAFDAVSAGLAGNAGDLGSALDRSATLAGSLASLLDRAQPALGTDISSLTAASDGLAAQRQQIDAVLTSVPGLLQSLDKIASHGSWLQVYVCDLTTEIHGNASLPGAAQIAQLPPALAQLLAPVLGTATLPLKFPAGTVGNPALHTRNCS